jgi:uncharacterized delta-60 repeat protein
MAIERRPAMGHRTCVGLIATAAIVLAGAGTSAAAAGSGPARIWSFSEVRQGSGTVQAAHGAQQGGLLDEHHVFGGAAFNFPESEPRDRATGTVFSSASGKRYSVLAQAPTYNPFQPGSKRGGIAHLDQFQAYEKQDPRASLSITISKVVLDVIDANHGLLPSECPPGLRCRPIRALVRFHARAYAESAGGDFFSTGGSAFIEGHEGRWSIDAVTSSDARRALWKPSDFEPDDSVDDAGTGSRATQLLKRPRTLRVPLKSVREGDLFAVHVTMDAEAIDSRGRESAAEAFIQDPQTLRPALLTSKGLKRRGAPRFREPRVKPLAAARCPSGPRRGAGRLQLGAPAYATDEAAGVPMLVLVTRNGGTRGAASVTLRTRAGSAAAGKDFRTRRTTVRFASGDASPRLVEIPILDDAEPEAAQTFTVGLSHARCARLGSQHSAPVTIVDDDTPPVATPSFTVGGTVDGLQGTGLVLHDVGSDLNVSANGPFALPGTRADGLPYDVRVATQPRSPDQICAVSNGAGTIHGGDVGDIAIHCTTPAPPPGIDPTFGTGGLVSTPVGAGKGEAVLIQPDGGIVTAGRRAFGGGIDFALTRHDARGRLDTGFGTQGIVTTDLGTPGDEAFDAALDPDGGFVVAGRTDPAAFDRDIGVVRYRDDGTPDPGFGGGDGIVTTDVAGQTDQANAIAVQPDGKVIVAGIATSGGAINPDGDFVLIRYRVDGTPDPDFGGGDGIVTTDLGTTGDTARAIVIQSDGRIVVAGTADGDVALARYTTAGELDDSFGDQGTRISDFGNDDFANGVALTADGHILVAGHTLGSGTTLDFALARYTSAGNLDRAFDGDGIVTTDIGGGDDFAENLTVQPDGRIVVVGRATSATILDMAVVRYRADGTPDAGFGAGGIVTADFHGRGEFGQDVALQPDGRIVVAGYTANGLDTEFALMRLNP